MQHCAGSTTQQWTQLPSGTTSDTVVLYNETDGVYLGTSGSKVADSASQADWSAAVDGNGYSLEQPTGGNTGVCVDDGSDSANSAVTLQSCSSGASQALTLPATPYTGSGNSNGSGGPVDDAPVSTVSFTPTAPSPSQGDDISYLLSLLQQNGQKVNCTTLSTADRTACESVFGSN